MIPLNKNQNNLKIKENKSLLKTKTSKNPEPELNEKTNSKTEGIIEYIFIKFSNSVRLIGPLFAFCLVMFVIAVANTAFTFIIPYWMKNFHFIFVFLYLIALYLLFSILFNYFLAVLVKPGSLADIRNSRFFKKNDPLKVSTNVFNFENSKLAENLKNFNEEEKQNSGAFAAQIKIRYKTNENSLLSVSGNENCFAAGAAEGYNVQDDLKILDNLENSQNDLRNSEKRKFNEIKFNFDSEAVDGVNNEDLENYNKLMGNGCIYPRDQIKASLNGVESSIDSADNSINTREETRNEVCADNKEDQDFIQEMDQKLESFENPFPFQEKTESSSSIKKLSECKYCIETKPLRAHHCTICDLCVMKMDHHCPWINNCVGQNNHRYFVLFLTHTLFGCIFVLFIGLPIIFNSAIKKTQECSFIFILCFAGTFLLVFFNSWNWFLILKGYTTIEFWSNQAFSANKSKLNLNEFYMCNWKENLFLVFGTKSIFEAVFLPSIRKLPFSGLEWTKMVYPSFQLEIRDLDEEKDLDILLGQGEGEDNLDVLCDESDKRNNNNSKRNSKYLDLV